MYCTSMVARGLVVGTIGLLLTLSAAGARHHLGLAELGARDAERAVAHLAPGNLGAAMRLRVRPEILAGRARVRGHPAKVALEAVEVEEQRGRWDIVARHRRWMLRCWMLPLTS